MPKDRMMDVGDDDDNPPQRGARLSGPEGYMDWLDTHNNATTAPGQEWRVTKDGT